MADHKKFFDALVERPLQPNVEADRRVYVDGLHLEEGGTDTIMELAQHMSWEDPGRAYLFTGQRGTGKTTELYRLKEQLESEQCQVFYVDIGEFLLLTDRVEITDFLTSMLGGWSQAISNELGADVLHEGYLTRFWNFLQSEVKVEGLELGTEAAGIEANLKLALQTDPTFKRTIRDKARGYTSRFIQHARAFAKDAVTRLRAKIGSERRIVIIVDSFERIRGTGDEAEAVFASVAEMFGQQPDSLRFEGVQIVYTVPPWLLAMSGALGAYYGGSTVFALSSLHLFKARTRAVEAGGLDLMRQIVAKRYPEWEQILPRTILESFATSAGGDLRDYFRLIKVALGKASTRSRVERKSVPIDEKMAEETCASVRREMLPIAEEDLKWLRKIAQTKEPCLPEIKKLPVLARFFDSKLVLNYRNGDDWYDVHPLVRDDVGTEG